MRVRFRVDGVLYEAARVPKRMVSGVVSRIKIMSELDIAEKRVPQDGRVSVNVEDRKVDLRVTTLPTQRGEGATIRILDKEQALRTLDELGMDGDGARRASRRRSASPTARCWSPGPTGSGKSTTLYAALNELNAVEKNIITIEDPVEYRLDGINQISVNRKAGLDFATGLRSILRADPDVIMVGEIRDAETARIAIESALTGHMVLSHAAHQRRARARSRACRRWGSRRFLTASAVDCVVAQRLARKLCSALQAAHRDPAGRRSTRPASASAPTSRPTSRSAARAAASTGYRGRIGLFSVMVMSERIKELTVDGAPEAEITAGRPRGGHAHPARGRPAEGPRRASPRSRRSPASPPERRRSTRLRAKAARRSDD